MKLLSALVVIFLYLEIFPKQTTGLNLVQYNCESPYSYCFTISDEKANWDTANATCVQQGGKLINYGYYWINDIIQANNGGEYYWTGWRRVGNTSVFQSMDGDTISDYDYDCKDNNSIAGINCVGFDGESRKILSLECNTNNTVVCEIDNEDCHAEVYKDVCSSIASCSGIPTECYLRNLTLNLNLTTDDIIGFLNNLYEPPALVITRLKANAQIQIPVTASTIQIGTDTFLEDTTLVIHSTDNTEQFNNDSFILWRAIVTIYTNKDTTGTFRISFEVSNSADYKEYECVYLRSDGNWSAEGLTTQCVSMNSERRVQCASSIHGTTTYGVQEINKTEHNTIPMENSVTDGNYSPCSRPTTNRIIASFCQSPFTTVCNNTVLSNWDTGGICYSISNDKATWSVANATCVRNGGRLARISNGEISGEIQRIINDKNGTEDYWIGLKRVGNTGQFQWTDGTNLTYNKWIINIPIQEFGCVGVKGWYWFSLNCTESHYYICETDVCIGWRVRNGICYKKFETNTNWNRAVGLCERKNAYLAEIPNIYVSDQINYLIGQDECWIGLSAVSSDYSWRIGNFSLSDPTTAVALNSKDTNKCGTIGIDGGYRWGLRDCNDTQTCAVCMKGPLTSEYPLNACNRVNRATIVDRGICYRINVRRNTELDLASLTCNRLNGELYRFNEVELNLRLINIFNSFYNHNLYPKLFPNQTNLFTPQDGYFNLLTSNVNLTTPVKCQELNNGGLQETDCTNVNFICKIEYEPFQRILERILTNETCYWSVTGNSNWTEAETECVTEGGHLVEIFNEDTQNIIVSLIATKEEYLDELYWIGIGEYVNSSSQWRSGASIVFSNFSIITTYLNSRCVAIDKSGSWNILDCENKYSFVCGKNVTGVDNSPCPNPTTATTPTQNTTQPTNATTQANTTQRSQPTDATTQQEHTTTPDSQNEGASNCNTKLSDIPTCVIISETLENGKNVTSIQEKEELIEVILTSVDVMTGTMLELMSSELNAVLILVGYNQSQSITINIGENTLVINKGSFPADVTVIIAIHGNTTNSNNSDTQTLTTGELVKTESNFITIVASENLIGKLTIVFPIKASDYELKKENLSHVTHWIKMEIGLVME